MKGSVPYVWVLTWVLFRSSMRLSPKSASLRNRKFRLAVDRWQVSGPAASCRCVDRLGQQMDTWQRLGCSYEVPGCGYWYPMP
jgi:hypothetical protein